MSGRPEPTPAQWAACTTLNRNLLVNAGAGSGKTWVLVERFVHLLAHPQDSGITSVGQILAITFTTKAAQEMRARVRDRLNQMLADAPDDESRLFWARHLGDLDGARISTIHALAASLLRANAADLDEALSPAFEVLDEVQSRLLADAAVDDVLRDIPPDDPALAVFAAYRTDAILDELRAAVFRSWPDLPEAVLGHWRDSQRQVWERVRPGLVAAFVAHLDLQVPLDVPVDDLRVQAWRCAQEAVAALETSETSWQALADLKAISLRGGSRKAWGAEAFDDCGTRLRRLREASVEAVAWLGESVDERPDSLDARAAALAQCWHALVCRAQARYRSLKAARGAVDFDDLERLALALLENPDVRARYDGAEFRHVMVDEFQDTSETQWAIIQRLADPSRPGSLFLVGDPKQSIYGFRGADARVFDKARTAIEANGGQVLSLARSFRTHAQLVSQFNALFRQLLVRDDGSLAAAFQTVFGADDEMDARRQSDPALLPALEFMLTDKANAADAEDSARAREAQAIARRIETLAAEGCPYGDITLLFRATSAMDLYEGALKEAGIPYVTVGGRGYYSRQEVWDVLALLRAVYQPEDTLSLATALRSPMFGLSDDALLALRWPGDGGVAPDLWQSMERAAACDLPGFPVAEVQAAGFAWRTLGALHAAAGRVSLVELIERALAETGYRALVSALPDGARRRGNLDKLIAKAADAGPLSLGAFLQTLMDLTERETREGEAVVDVTGAVRLMTIHAAKGLEFPVVILADAARDSRGGQAALLTDDDVSLAVWLPPTGRPKGEDQQSFAWRLASNVKKARDDAELRRLLYVACTRARDRLIISAAARRNKNGGLGTLNGLIGLVAALPGFNDQVEACLEGMTDLTWCEGPVGFSFLSDVRGAARTESPSAWPPSAPVPAEPPALLGLVPRNRPALAASLPVAALADLGTSLFADGGSPAESARQRWQVALMSGAAETAGLPVGEQMGRAVRAALYWDGSSNRETGQRALLESALWEAGLLPDRDGAHVLERALDLLARARRAPLQREIAAARVVWHDLPFLWKSGTLDFHGTLDTLFQTTDGGWTLVGEHGAPVAGLHSGGLQFEANRLAFPMAVCAAAARDLLALPNLAVYIHFIAHQQTVVLSPAQLAEALARLDAEVGRAWAEDVFA